jgi:hypothetical protein
MCLILWNFGRRELEIVKQRILQDKEGRMELQQMLEECQRELEAAQSAQKARF